MTLRRACTRVRAGEALEPEQVVEPQAQKAENSRPGAARGGSGRDRFGSDRRHRWPWLASGSGSMVERELTRVEQRPEQVLGRLAERRGLLQLGRPVRQLLAGRRPAEGAEVEVLDDLVGLGLELAAGWRDSRSGLPTLLSITSPPITSSDWRRLKAGVGDRGTAVDVGGSGRRCRGSCWPWPGRRTSIARSRASFGIAVDHVGRLRQGVGHLVGGQRPGHLVREEPGVAARCPARSPTTARTPRRPRSSGSGRGGRTCGSTKCLASASSSSGWTGGFDRLRSSGGSASPLAEELGPDPVGHRAGEIGVVGRRHPVGQRLARVLLGRDLDRRAVEQPGLGGAWSAGARSCPSGSILIDLPLIIPPPPAAAALDLGEAGGQAEIVVLGPDVEGMVVALGAANPQAQEPLRCLLGRTLASGPSSA